MSTFLILLGLIVILVGIVAVIRPLPKLKLPNRKAGAFAALGGLALMIAGGAMAPTPASAPIKADASPIEHEKSALVIGTPIKIREAEVTITSAETRSSVGGQYIGEKASEGGVLVVVAYTIKNVGDRPLSFFSPNIQLMDPAGTVYSADIGKSAAYAMEVDLDQKAFSDLNPGITTRGADVFEVSAQAFDPATWKVIVDGKRNSVAIK